MSISEIHVNAELKKPAKHGLVAFLECCCNGDKLHGIRSGQCCTGFGEHVDAIHPPEGGCIVHDGVATVVGRVRIRQFVQQHAGDHCLSSPDCQQQGCSLPFVRQFQLCTGPEQLLHATQMAALTRECKRRLALRTLRIDVRPTSYKHLHASKVAGLGCQVKRGRGLLVLGFKQEAVHDHRVCLVQTLQVLVGLDAVQDVVWRHRRLLLTASSVDTDFQHLGACALQDRRCIPTVLLEASLLTRACSEA
mmetsp:Transcript_100522/g.322601  ORF Transcript_100522/g.322601 Transcript_100522/m.322601 type:complete len:249 (-) Transcript_100522:2243-2989(-)